MRASHSVVSLKPDEDDACVRWLSGGEFIKPRTQSRDYTTKIRLSDEMNVAKNK